MYFPLKYIINRFLLICIMVSLGISVIACSEERGLNGWGFEEPYNNHYDVKKFEKFKGRVIKVKEIVPMAGMSPAVALDVQKNGEVIEVQLCPTWVAKPSAIGVQSGDRITIRGVRAQINGKDVFMASKIKKSNFFEFKIRLTKNGKPFWTMTPEELSRERAMAKE